MQALLPQFGFDHQPLFIEFAAGDDFAVDFGDDFFHHACVRVRPIRSRQRHAGK